MNRNHLDYELEQKKAQLIEAARNVDFLRPLKEHPWVTVAGAAAAGVAAGSWLPLNAGKAVNTLGAFTKALQPALLAIGQWLAARHAAQSAAEHAAADGPEGSAGMSSAEGHVAQPS
jgi:hypothetical protein